MRSVCKANVSIEIVYRFKMRNTFVFQEFVENSPDDRTYNSLFTFENGKLTHRQNKIKENHKSSVLTTWLENGKLIQTYQSGDVICRREWERE